MDEAAISGALPGCEEVGARAGLPHKRALAATYRRAATADFGRRSGKRLRGRQRILQLAGAQEIQAARARFSEPIPWLRNLPGMRRDSSARRSARRSNRGKIDYRSLQTDGERGSRFLFHTGAFRGAAKNRRQNP